MDRYIGKRLDGRYEIQEIIGVGGMAVVYKAYDNIEDRIVAVKILKEEFVSNEEFTRRFKNESKAIAVLSHPNIVKVFDVSFGDLIQYIVMEYIDGITLKELIEKQGSLRWKDAVYFTIQILKGLQHAHDKGIVHRDVKPQNIMVLSDGTIKVTDFGIARFARSEQRTITDKAIGSVHYISPEQARGEATDEKADIYSVGVMLYEMLTGQLPFVAESAVSVAIMQLQREPQMPRDINGSIPEGLEQITMHAMQKSIDRRYKSAAEMLCDLEEFKKDPAITFGYNYFVDDSPTKYVSDVPEAAEYSDEDDEKSDKSPIIPILAGVASAFLIGIVVLLFIFLPRLFGGTGSEMKCPDFIGKQWEEVINNKEYDENFDFEVQWGESAEQEFGYIYNQSKDPGRSVKVGSKITLYVSQGQKTVKVPDLHGKSVAEAVTTLKGMGFKVGETVKITDEEYAEGLVVKTDPGRGIYANQGAEIIIYESTGAPTVYVDLPDLVGLTEEAAKKRLEAEGLAIGTITPVDNSKLPKGYVVAQSPNPKESKTVGKGSAVDLSISTGETKYTVKFDLELPDNYKYDVGVVSVFADGEVVFESKKIEINKLDKYTVEFTSNTEHIDEIIIKLSDGTTSTMQDYMEYYDVDCKNGTMKKGSTYPVDTKDTSSSQAG